jgi:hypothetical protein
LGKLSFRVRLAKIREQIDRVGLALWITVAISPAVVNLAIWLLTTFLGGGTLKAAFAWTKGLALLPDWVTGLSVGLAIVGLAVRAIYFRNPAERLERLLGRRDWRTKLARSLVRTSRLDAQAALNRLTFSLASPKDIALASRINAVAFERSATYFGGFEEKLDRNTGIVGKCPDAIRLVRLGDKTIGLSFLVPLTPDFYREYLEGRISDHHIVPAEIPAPGEAVGCILLFAIALGPEYEAERGKIRKLVYIKHLILAHMLHIQVLLNLYDAREAPLVVQVEKASIRRMLQGLGFTRAGDHRGNDGDPLYEATLASIVEAIG